jgi:hypothetical protein
MMPELVSITFIIEPLHSTILHRFPLKVLQGRFEIFAGSKFDGLASTPHPSADQPTSTTSPAYGLIPFPQCAKSHGCLQAIPRSQCDARSWWRWEPGRWSSYPGPGQPTKWEDLKDKRTCDIPLRTIQSVDTANLFAGGRLADGEGGGGGSIRVMGTAFVTGQAAGVAAAKWARARTIEVAKVQAELRRQGAILAYEAMPNHSRFSSVGSFHPASKCYNGSSCNH